MKTSKILTGTLAVLTLLSLAGSALADPWFGSNRRFGNNGWRQDCHSSRIFNGIRSGALTRPEARNLWRSAGRINRYQRLASADGYVSPVERWRLQRMNRQYNRTFYRDINDWQRRW